MIDFFKKIITQDNSYENQKSNLEDTQIIDNERKRKDLGINILIIEYQSHRKQIIALMALEVQAVNFALIGISILMGILSQSHVREFISNTPEILLAPIPVFTIFGLMHLYEKFRVFCTVIYIEKHIKKTLKKNTSVEILEWEGYLKKFYKNSKYGNMLSKLRNLIFILPTITLLSLFVIFSISTINCIRIILFVVTLLLILMHFRIIRRITISNIEKCIKE